MDVSAVPRIQVLRNNVRYNYAARSNVELSVARGNIVHIVKSDHTNWWYGECNGKFGYIPKNYLAKSPAPVLLTPNIATALYYNEAPDQSTTELSFDVGRTIYVLEDDSTDWWYGMTTDFKAAGYFPANYVEVLMPDGISPPPSEAPPSPSPAARMEENKEDCAQKQQLAKVADSSARNKPSKASGRRKSKKQPVKPEAATLRFKKKQDFEKSISVLKQHETDKEAASDLPPPLPACMSTDSEARILAQAKIVQHTSPPVSDRGSIELSESLRQLEIQGGPSSAAPTPPGAAGSGRPTNTAPSPPAAGGPTSSEKSISPITSPASSGQPPVAAHAPSQIDPDVMKSPTAQRLAQQGDLLPPAQMRGRKNSKPKGKGRGRGIKPSERHGWKPGGSGVKPSQAKKKEEEKKEKEIEIDDSMLDFGDDMLTLRMPDTNGSGIDADLELPPIDKKEKPKGNPDLRESIKFESDDLEFIDADMELPPIDEGASKGSRDSLSCSGGDLRGTGSDDCLQSSDPKKARRKSTKKRSKYDGPKKKKLVSKMDE